jgi:hypothetical protein
MFKKGDEVVCINNTNDDVFITNITIGKRYIILSNHRGMVYIRNNIGNMHSYSEKRFTSIVEYRKIQLNRIYSNIIKENYEKD